MIQEQHEPTLPLIREFINEKRCLAEFSSDELLQMFKFADALNRDILKEICTRNNK